MDNEEAAQPEVKKRRLPNAFYNPTTMVGSMIALASLVLIVFLFALDILAGGQNAYMGLITLIFLPGVMLFGLFLGVMGIMRARRREKAGLPESKMLKVDFNNPRHRNAFTGVLIGGFLLMALSAFGSYQAYQYTESVEFCGKVCHSVMKPEFVAYQHSPHAKVKCAECHIGAGADWYVRSKISGAYQVYSTIFNKYNRPIETPVANLRPAKETCEECHWPSHFYSQKLKDRTYYLSDEENTRVEMSMLMKIGGVEHGQSEGIHAHMYLDHEISYYATDRQRQEIPYVEAKGPDGKVRVYRNKEIKFNDADIKKGERRVVDCIDCHNRPSHQYKHPEMTMNQAMSNGLVDIRIPEIKAVAVEALEKEYKTENEALAGIKKHIEDYYKENHAEKVAGLKNELASAIKHVQEVYQHNYFPEMKVSWKAFPSNLDHLHSNGCFRCHDGKHVSDDGKVISKDCQSCHTILSQKGQGMQKAEVSITGLEFRHPADIGDSWKDTPCKDCHGVQTEEEE